MRWMSDFISIIVISRLIGVWFLPPTTFDPHTYVLPPFFPFFMSALGCVYKCRVSAS